VSEVDGLKKFEAVEWRGEVSYCRQGAVAAPKEQVYAGFVVMGLRKLSREGMQGM
jgi:hypothetical protein